MYPSKVPWINWLTQGNTIALAYVFDASGVRKTHTKKNTTNLKSVVTFSTAENRTLQSTSWKSSSIDFQRTSAPPGSVTAWRSKGTATCATCYYYITIEIYNVTYNGMFQHVLGRAVILFPLQHIISSCLNFCKSWVLARISSFNYIKVEFWLKICLIFCPLYV